MHCVVNYGMQYNISTAEWLCDTVLHICNNASTFNPTKIRTTNPISAPTHAITAPTYASTNHL